MIENNIFFGSCQCDFVKTYICNKTNYVLTIVLKLSIETNMGKNLFFVSFFFKGIYNRL